MALQSLVRRGGAASLAGSILALSSVTGAYAWTTGSTTQAVYDTKTTAVDTPVVVDILANDTCAAGFDKAYATSNSPAGGGLYYADVTTANGTWSFFDDTTAPYESHVRFTPKAGFTGEDKVPYRLVCWIEGGNQESTGVVAVTVGGGSGGGGTTTPRGAKADVITATSDTVTYDLASNDTCVEPTGVISDASFTAYPTDTNDQNADGATWSLSGTTLTATRTNPSATSSASHYYLKCSVEATDSNAPITVNWPAAQPTYSYDAVDDSATTSEDVSVTVDLAVNDVCTSNSCTRRFTWATEFDTPTDYATLDGRWTLDGSRLTFTPNAGFVGTTSTDYDLYDAGVLKDTAKITVTVNKWSAPAGSFGDLWINATGTVMSDGNNNTVSVPIGTGSAATGVYTLQVWNRAGTAQTFRISAQQLGVPATAKIYLWNTSTELAKDAVGNWVTPKVASNNHVGLWLKVDPSPVGSQVTAKTRLRLLSDAGVEQDRANFETNVQAPSAGTDGSGVFVRAGSQAFVGGNVEQRTTSAALDTGQTASYTVRLRNDTTTSSTVVLTMAGESSPCWSIKVTRAGWLLGLGETDLTSTVFGSGYSVTLPSGAISDLSVKVTRVNSGCGDAAWTVNTDGGNAIGSTAGLIAVAKADTVG